MNSADPPKSSILKRLLWLLWFALSTSVLPGLLTVLGVLEIVGPISHAIEFGLPIRLAISAVLLGSAVVMAFHERRQESRLKRLRGYLTTLGTILRVPVGHRNQEDEGQSEIARMLEGFAYVLSRNRRKKLQVVAAVLTLDQSSGQCILIASYPANSPAEGAFVATTKSVFSSNEFESCEMLHAPSTDSPVGLSFLRMGDYIQHRIVSEIDHSAFRANAPEIKSLLWVNVPTGGEGLNPSTVILLLGASSKNVFDQIDFLEAKVAASLIASSFWAHSRHDEK